ncbi:hypothetical protein T4B_12842 [Trichinella pseudospiralis]|uniref:Uncharacterized protein n=2 Tax=Trichinella pseudospiralis TaxID=6337 RepID=A0A0V1K5Z5_TRIPS|nr:hypothetical protein T4A_14197 [Trichinella pseudospiralis]KRZ33937.1 hypothetical protein T4B_12842 [Trichinella pseudospiralis]KRZ42635.1 hypothetical protein T4C_11537 [Trichinella pseudospiralis]
MADSRLRIYPLFESERMSHGKSSGSRFSATFTKKDVFETTSKVLIAEAPSHRNASDKAGEIGHENLAPLVSYKFSETESVLSGTWKFSAKFSLSFPRPGWAWQIGSMRCKVKNGSQHTVKPLTTMQTTTIARRSLACRDEANMRLVIEISVLNSPENE